MRQCQVISKYFSGATDKAQRNSRVRSSFDPELILGAKIEGDYHHNQSITHKTRRGKNLLERTGQWVRNRGERRKKNFTLICFLCHMLVQLVVFTHYLSLPSQIHCLALTRGHTRYAITHSISLIQLNRKMMVSRLAHTSQAYDASSFIHTLINFLDSFVRLGEYEYVKRYFVRIYFCQAPPVL